MDDPDDIDDMHIDSGTFSLFRREKGQGVESTLRRSRREPGTAAGV
jgi:hypothetical protein